MITTKKLIRKAVELICTAVIILFCIGAAYLLAQTFIFAPFTIPSESMTPGLLPGDRIVVDKLSTGARLFNIFRAAKGEEPEIRRMPAFTGFRRGDVIVFNFPHKTDWNRLEFNYPVYYAKRCVAVPGDTVSIRNFIPYINGRKLPFEKEATMLAALHPDDSLSRAARTGYLACEYDTVNRWTIREFGPLIIPGKGIRIKLDSLDYMAYRPVIERETGSRLFMRNGRLLLGARPIEAYQFKENYYFTLGDNFTASMDSRYWGFVPEKYIVGKARFIWWSRERKGEKRIRWNRILKTID